MAMSGGWRVVAQNFLRSAAEVGISANSAIKQMQDAGLFTYRRTDMLADYRQFAGLPEKTDRLKYVRLDYQPGRGLYTEIEGYQRATFRYQVRIDCSNPITGKAFSMNTNISSEVQLTRRQIEEAGLDAVNKTVESYKDDVVSYGVIGAFHKPGEAWD